MTRADMTPKAVTVRLVRTAQLRRLCLELRRRSKPRRDATSPAGWAADDTAEAVAEDQGEYREGLRRLDD